MKVAIALAAVIAAVAATPLAAQTPDEVLEKSLVAATRKAVKVAPWVKLTVADVVTKEKLEWVATTGPGQRYACTAPADADALLAGAAATCTRLTAEASASERLSGAADLYNQSQRARIPFPGQYSGSGN